MTEAFCSWSIMKYALLHVSLPFLVCVAVANTNVFNNVLVLLRSCAVDAPGHHAPRAGRSEPVGHPAHLRLGPSVVQLHWRGGFMASVVRPDDPAGLRAELWPGAGARTGIRGGPWGAHRFYTVLKGVRVHRVYGDPRSQRHLLLALVSCSGFVGLKLLDHWLARYALFQCVTGHFWSKVCDVLQFHFSFCLLTCLTERAQARKKTR